MKGVVWIPEDEHDQRIEAYLDSAHQAPYIRIGAIALAIFCMMTVGILMIVL